MFETRNQSKREPNFGSLFLFIIKLIYEKQLKRKVIYYFVNISKKNNFIFYNFKTLSNYKQKVDKLLILFVLKSDFNVL